jgi:hypothetical protein
MKKYLSKPKVRKPHHSYHHGLQQKRVKATSTAPKINSTRATEIISVVVIIFGLLGLGITFFGGGESILWLIVGTLIGLAFGYFFGVQIVKGLSKK